jgi:hypothetical protein
MPRSQWGIFVWLGLACALAPAPAAAQPLSRWRLAGVGKTALALEESFQEACEDEASEAADCHYPGVGEGQPGGRTLHFVARASIRKDGSFDLSRARAFRIRSGKCPATACTSPAVSDAALREAAEYAQKVGVELAEMPSLSLFADGCEKHWSGSGRNMRELPQSTQGKGPLGGREVQWEGHFSKRWKDADCEELGCVEQLKGQLKLQVGDQRREVALDVSRQSTTMACFYVRSATLHRTAQGTFLLLTHGSFQEKQTPLLFGLGDL